jgi:methylenetetrahydrofolate dehydrogenase (NADP+)/methenyltetrahydrofolate cyclohydrolase
VTARILDGKAIARAIQAELGEQTAEFIESSGVTPCLAAVLVGADAASEVYVRSKRRACERLGLQSQLYRLSADTDQESLLGLIGRLNKAREVHGILVQLPLPAHLSAARILDAVHPLKDVDCFHPENVGLLMQGRARFLPCTPHGVQQILRRSQIEVAGRRVVILGRSDIVGKPLAAMLMQRVSGPEAAYANATVTVAHSRTRDLASVTREAEILVAAIGQPLLVTAEMVRPGAVVIDVGINRTAEGLVGDVDFATVCGVASVITPVPGGVGPLTVTMLLHNTLAAAELQLS